MITDHAFRGDDNLNGCDFIYQPGPVDHKFKPYPCGLNSSGHALVEQSAPVSPAPAGSNAGLRGKATSPEAAVLEEADRRLPVRAADAAQYAREAIPTEQRGQIRVRLLNATPDPLGSIAALCEQYKGHVIRSLSEVTDEQRRACLDDMASTVLNGPLEAAQFHFQIEGVTRSITHQMVRSRASFFAQESLRFAVPEGNWAEEIPLPPSLAAAQKSFDAARREQDPLGEWYPIEPQEHMLRTWEAAMGNAQLAYESLVAAGMPAEEARGVLPHDMPTRIHWVLDLRTLLTEAGKRTCTQAQFPWRLIFAGMAESLRNWGTPDGTQYTPRNPKGFKVSGDQWQFREIANRLRPVCFQTGQCGFMAKFDRSCSIRSRVDANAKLDRPSSSWGQEYDVVPPETFVVGVGPQSVVVDEQGRPVFVGAIQDWEWMANPGAARS